MDRFEAVIEWQKLKTKIDKGYKRVDSDTLRKVYFLFNDKQRITMLQHMYEKKFKTDYLDITTLPYGISLSRDHLAAKLTNKKLALSMSQTEYTINVFNAMVPKYYVSFCIFEDYLRSTNQQKSILYKHIIEQLNVNGTYEPEDDYTKDEWDSISSMYNETKTARVPFGRSKYTKESQFFVNGVTYTTSYDSIITMERDDIILLGQDYNRSRTTIRQLQSYLCSALSASYAIEEYKRDGKFYIYQPTLKRLIEG